MKLLAFLVLTSAFLALSASCESAREAEPTPAPSSGIQGRVVIGPVCPVEREDTPCPDQPYAASVIVWNAEQTERVATFETGEDGRFRVPLPPGEYYIEPQPPQSGAPPSPIPQTVAVPAGRFIGITIEYDSGIR